MVKSTCLWLGITIQGFSVVALWSWITFFLLPFVVGIMKFKFSPTQTFFLVKFSFQITVAIPNLKKQQVFTHAWWSTTTKVLSGLTSRPRKRMEVEESCNPQAWEENM